MTVMNHCPFCKGPVERQRVEHIHRWKGSLYIFRNVPAEVCSQCGEVFFGPGALQAMDDIVKGNQAPLDRLSVPVYSL